MDYATLAKELCSNVEQAKCFAIYPANEDDGSIIVHYYFSVDEKVTWRQGEDVQFHIKLVHKTIEVTQSGLRPSVLPVIIQKINDSIAHWQENPDKV